MLVGVCCECQQGGKSLRFERGRAIIDSHDAFGSFCPGSGTAPQASYDPARIEKDPAYAAEKLAGVKVCVIEGKGASGPECDGETCTECNAGPIFSLEDHAASCSKSTFRSDRERAVSISIGSLNGVMIGRAENVSISVGDLAKKWGAKKRC
jgi:hypothetical protein